MPQIWIMLTACSCTHSGSHYHAYIPLHTVVAAMPIMCDVVIMTLLTGGLPDIVVVALMQRVASAHKVQTPSRMH